MQDTNAINTPFGTHFKLSAKMSPQVQEDKRFMYRVPYYNVVGNFMYVMVCTRSNIVCALRCVSPYMDNPRKVHWQVVKWILRYLKGSTGIGLVFERGTIEVINHITGFCDSNYVSDLNCRRSFTDYIFTLWGSVICWRAILHPTISLSTT